MTAREQAEQLRQQAIQTLLEEKKAIDEMLRMLGYDETGQPEKRRGRWPKQEVGQQLAVAGRERGELDNSETSQQLMPVARSEA